MIDISASSAIKIKQKKTEMLIFGLFVLGIQGSFCKKSGLDSSNKRPETTFPNFLLWTSSQRLRKCVQLSVLSLPHPPTPPPRDKTHSVNIRLPFVTSLLNTESAFNLFSFFLIIVFSYFVYLILCIILL